MLKTSGVLRLALIIVLLATLAISLVGLALGSQTVLDRSESEVELAHPQPAAVIASECPGTSGSGCGGG